MVAECIALYIILGCGDLISEEERYKLYKGFHYRNQVSRMVNEAVNGNNCSLTNKFDIYHLVLYTFFFSDTFDDRTVTILF